MNFLEWLKSTLNMSLEKFYELPDEKQMNIEQAYKEYVENTKE